MNKAQTMDMLREQCGYSEAKADLAANKICRDLKLDKEKFLAHMEQYDNLNSENEYPLPQRRPYPAGYAV